MKAETKAEMTSKKTQWLIAAAVLGIAVGGIVSSNAGCGSSSSTTDSGAAGTGGGGTGGTFTAKVSYTFDADKEGWTLSDYVDANYKNLGAAANPDSGVNLDGGMVPTLEWSSTDGNPNPGSLKLTVTFSDFKQYVDPQVLIGTPADLTGRILKVKIRLVSGTFPSGGIQFHVSSGLTAPNNYVYVSAPFVNANTVTAGGPWITVNLDTSTVTPTDGRVFDPSQIIQVGIQFTTGDPFEGGTLTFGEAVFEIDTVQG
jgi:hypothetical protein